MKDIAILGGGLAGCLAALNIAEAGHRAVIYEREASLLRRASLANEGKVHLGYVYAADQSFATARRMILDAFDFTEQMSRFIAQDDYRHAVTDSFVYSNSKKSLLSDTIVDAHFRKVDEFVKEITQLSPQSYIQFDHERAHHIPIETEFETQRWQTSERAISPRIVANAIKQAVESHPNIDVQTSFSVHRVRQNKSKWTIEAAQKEDLSKFHYVLNHAWAGRTAIDENSGFRDGATWYSRYKYGVVLKDAKSQFPDAFPKNVTVMVGPFGDTVYYPSEDILYCSWYPVGLRHSTVNTPLDECVDIPTDISGFAEQSWQGMKNYCPELAKLTQQSETLSLELLGDFIMAKGNVDIDDIASELHHRHDHAPTELAPGYLTIPTGKYTSAGRVARQSSQAVLDAA